MVGFGVQGYGPAAKVEFSFPDGLNDPWLHLATAKTLAHPAMDDTCILSDIQDNMEYASSAQMGLVHERMQAVKCLQNQVRSLEDATKQQEPQPARASRP